MKAKSKITVLLIDSHKLFRAGIRALLMACDRIQVIGEANDGPEGLRLFKRHTPDIVLLDIVMPTPDSIEATARILDAFPPSRVVLLSLSADQDWILKALRTGAAGYLVTTADPAELEQAIRTVARGEKFFSSAVSEKLVTGCLNRLDMERTSLEQLSP